MCKSTKCQSKCKVPCQSFNPTHKVTVIDAELDKDVDVFLKEVHPEPTKPSYYKFNIKGIQCNMFDIARALGLSLELFSALKYFRVKGDTAKRINDLQKAKQCIDMEIENLSKEFND